ncbi:type II secretion system protein N [Jeongeupia naejangsanensis]|uniref:Type II secretion system protein N n=1 Tax=Jeongeupia naejangsanensis TaxID=613195 RepID=A0ABS2BI74_9NEIS|nr:type II secretion system protein N [Jeongeupia naejangsanensis]MBM3115301.1 type II secretion system protein N [Jeongeupia naejangsanensis]
MKRLIITGGIAALLFIGIRLPASVLAGLVPAPLQLSGISGTLWAGSATQLGLDGQELVRGLSWRWQAAGLLRGELMWSLGSTDPATPVSAKLLTGLGGTRIEDLSARLPASPLLGQVRALAPFQLGGTLLINARRLDRQILADASVQWQDASSLVTPQANPFGSYNVSLQRNGQRLDWQLASLGGRLDIQGKGSIGPAGPQGELTLRAADGQAALFAPLLNSLPGDGTTRTLRLGAANP